MKAQTTKTYFRWKTLMILKQEEGRVTLIPKRMVQVKYGSRGYWCETIEFDSHEARQEWTDKQLAEGAKRMPGTK